MSPGMIKMWISVAGMALMFLAIITIYFSRYKLRGVLRVITAIIAYVFLIVAGLSLLIVFLG
ncbi:DUF2768 domain-containing protein [Neobacillus sp. MM2021_6]|uniref:DUF2768 domain-containing protein n=1 Tax=Bacillaceae TaxID=186817 RepID=UPI00140BA21B|nr:MULTISPECIES: DUF2768 domain-containing protein [Bacillaceae]MBO0958145.1 DUF2768 domain-containing protein [Neobacillus sp. MM2021_6]NHC18481.1 DUF2768 domain-containing protein [Bacillus sp. MM2020_4]WML40378.1 DUF2768 domain-containing protein [Neobacillus sp. OS1-2]